jgi:hypothetical protein
MAKRGAVVVRFPSSTLARAFDARGRYPCPGVGPASVGLGGGLVCRVVRQLN